MTELLNNSDFTLEAECLELMEDAFQRELDRRFTAFDFEDGETWPKQDGLHLGLKRGAGRVDAIILQWASNEPAGVWREVEVYAFIGDISPTGYTHHTCHSDHGRVQ